MQEQKTPAPQPEAQPTKTEEERPAQQEEEKNYQSLTPRKQSLPSQPRRNQPRASDSAQDLQKSSSRHKDSITLPTIPHQMNYGDRIFEKQSASTLQKTIVAYSMPKANRFNNDPKYTGEPSYCLDSCFKPNPTKGAGFGFGGKRQYPAWMERNMKENPPPGAYLDSNRELRTKGRTFGISHKYYEKVLIPKEKAVVQTNRKLSPIHDTK